MLRRRPFRRPRSPFTLQMLAFEILTIVVGVLIALGVNEARTRWSERKQGRQAAVALHSELGQNCVQLKHALQYHDRIKPRVDSTLAVNPQARGFESVPGADRGLGPAFVTTTAYEAAEATGALGLLDFDLVVGLGRVYTLHDLYQQAVRSTFALFSQGEMSLERLRIGTVPMIEIERETSAAACTAHRALSRHFNLPVDSAAVDLAEGVQVR